MSFSVNQTEKGIISYPLHSHSQTEIMYYLWGEGVLRTQNGDIPFAKGTVIIVPKGVEHGSVSKNGFCNISISDDSPLMPDAENVIKIEDTDEFEGEFYARQIYNHRFEDGEFTVSLRNTFYTYLHKFLKGGGPQINSKINEVVKIIREEFSNPDLCTSALLEKSGYSQDYIRHMFKARTGKTPVELLNETRINYSCFLIEVYKDSLSLSEIAEKCGFPDYSYFSKKFKMIKNISPADYKKSFSLK